MNKLISKKISNNPNPSKFRNPKFGEITNHKTNLEVGCGGASSRNGVSAAYVAGWSSGEERRRWIWGLGV